MRGSALLKNDYIINTLMEPRSVRKEERNYGENYRLAKNRSLIRHAEPEPSVRGEDMEYVFGLSAKQLRKKKTEEKQQELERYYPKNLKPTIEQQIMAEELPFSRKQVVQEGSEEQEGKQFVQEGNEEQEEEEEEETEKGSLTVDESIIFEDMKRIDVLYDATDDENDKETLALMKVKLLYQLLEQPSVYGNKNLVGTVKDSINEIFELYPDLIRV